MKQFVRRSVIGSIIAAFMLMLLSTPVWAEPSEENPAFIGFIADTTEFGDDSFYLLVVGEDEDNPEKEPVVVWIKVTEESVIIDQYGHRLEPEELPLGAQVIVMCYIVNFSFIEVTEALVFIPDEESEQDMDEEDEE
jgi:hypothetical protein